MYSPYSNGGIMKYILIIFIFASFLFSQVASTKQNDGLNAAGRPANSQLSSTMIQSDIQQSENDYSRLDARIEQGSELNAGGRPINARHNSMLIQSDIQQSENDYSRLDARIEQGSVLNAGGRPIGSRIHE